jgi:hypothetical protein
LEALIFGSKPNTLLFGGNKQWSGFIDAGGVAMVLQCATGFKRRKGMTTALMINYLQKQ